MRSSHQWEPSPPLRAANPSESPPVDIESTVDNGGMTDAQLQQAVTELFYQPAASSPLSLSELEQNPLSTVCAPPAEYYQASVPSTVEGRPRSVSLVKLDETYSDTGIVIGSGGHNNIRIFKSNGGKQVAVKAPAIKVEDQSMVNRQLHQMQETRKIQRKKFIIQREAALFEQAYPETISKVFHICHDGYYSYRHVQTLFEDAPTLRAHMERTPLRYADVIALFIAICLEVKRLHEINMCHGDIKDNNLLIIGQLIQFIDFGEAYLLTDKLFSIFSFKAEYLSPERCTRGTEHLPHTSQDIYSLCYMLRQHLENWGKNRQYGSPSNVTSALELLGLFNSGLADNPLARPTINEIIHGLETATSHIRKK